MSEFKVGDRVVVKEKQRRGVISSIEKYWAVIDWEGGIVSYKFFNEIEHDSRAYKAVEELETLPPSPSPSPRRAIKAHRDGTATITHEDGSRSYVARNGNIYTDLPPLGMPDSLESHSVESIPDATDHLSDSFSDTDWDYYNPDATRDIYDDIIHPSVKYHDWKYFYPDWEGKDVDDGPEVDILQAVGYGLSPENAERLMMAIKRSREDRRG